MLKASAGKEASGQTLFFFETIARRHAHARLSRAPLARGEGGRRERYTCLLTALETAYSTASNMLPSITLVVGDMSMT